MKKERIFDLITISILTIAIVFSIVGLFGDYLSAGGMSVGFKHFILDYPDYVKNYFDQIKVLPGDTIADVSIQFASRTMVVVFFIVTALVSLINVIRFLINMTRVYMGKDHVKSWIYTSQGASVLIFALATLSLNYQAGVGLGSGSWMLVISSFVMFFALGAYHISYGRMHIDFVSNILEVLAGAFLLFGAAFGICRQIVTSSVSHSGGMLMFTELSSIVAMTSGGSIDSAVLTDTIIVAVGAMILFSAFSSFVKFGFNQVAHKNRKGYPGFVFAIILFIGGLVAIFIGFNMMNAKPSIGIGAIWQGIAIVIAIVLLIVSKAMRKNPDEAERVEMAQAIPAPAPQKVEVQQEEAVEPAPAPVEEAKEVEEVTPIPVPLEEAKEEVPALEETKEEEGLTPIPVEEESVSPKRKGKK